MSVQGKCSTEIHAYTRTRTRTHVHTHAHTHTVLRPLVRDNPGRPVPAETLTHSHPSYHRTSFINFLHLLQRNYGEIYTDTHISKHTKRLHTHPFNGPYSKTTQVSQYQKGKTNLDFTEARDSEWQWHQLGHMQVCTSLQTENQTSTPPLCFLQAGCPSCRPTNGQGTEGKRLQNYKEITWSITIVQCPLDNFIIKKSNRHLTSYDRSVDQQQNASGSWIF